MGFPGGSDGEESACNMGDLGSIPGLGKSPRDTPVFLPGISKINLKHLYLSSWRYVLVT